MPYELKDGQGSLFRNERKQSDKHADWTGDCLIGGKRYWLNAWEKEGKKGKFFSLSIRPKEERTDGPAVRPAEQPKAEPAKAAVSQPSGASDDVPF